MPDIAQAYVQIIPTAKGITGELEKAMGGEADQAGKTAGKSFTSSFSSAIGSAGKSPYPTMHEYLPEIPIA